MGHSLLTFSRLYPDTIYRYWVYKKMFTPEETHNMYEDQSYFESDYATFGTISDVINLGYDHLIVFDIIDPDTKEHLGHKDFVPLSNICLSQFECDQKVPEEKDNEFTD